MILSPLWSPATLVAIQAWRTAMQQRSRGAFSVDAAGLVRCFYGLPFAIAILLAHLQSVGRLRPAA